ncbi:hypothetical protein SKAU_G00097870 [Synaphobranchus kaupii]|uniref:Uncharacterized protein n=1 Tax=Synaphobranchus kaupii TaxID=118154 RepID=A0A9Q1FXN1_SYNKA|nr:hypothetical protein SKAU_G00097870 [Synaphobranchus kaupii]
MLRCDNIPLATVSWSVCAIHGRLEKKILSSLQFSSSDTVTGYIIDVSLLVACRLAPERLDPDKDTSGDEGPSASTAPAHQGTTQGEKRRRFNPLWYNQWSWLEYSQIPVCLWVPWILSTLSLLSQCIFCQVEQSAGWLGRLDTVVRFPSQVCSGKRALGHCFSPVCCDCHFAVHTRVVGPSSD